MTHGCLTHEFGDSVSLFAAIIVSALAAHIMAAAVCTMHYTGMAVASVICTTANRKAVLPDLMRPDDLPSLVLTIAVGVALIIGTDLTMQRLGERRHRADAMANR